VLHHYPDEQLAQRQYKVRLDVNEDV